MIISITVILLLLALACFFVAAIMTFTKFSTRINLVALGLFFFVLTFMVR